MSRSYLDIARQGRNSWQRYVLGLLVILFGVSIGSAVVFFLLVKLFGLTYSAADFSQQLNQTTQAAPGLVYAVSSIAFISACLSIVIAVKGIHRRKFRTLISGDASISLNRLLLGLGVWFLLRIVSATIFYSFNPHYLQFNFDPVRWFFFLPVAFPFIFLGACAIEFFFRGYLLQGLGLLTQKPIVLVLVTTFLYAIQYRESETGWSNFIWGVFLATLVLKDNRLELALGIQTADSLFRWLLIGTTDSPLPALWVANTGGSEIVRYGFFLARIAVFYYLFFGRHHRPTPEAQNPEP